MPRDPKNPLGGHYDRSGNPIDVMEWCKLHENHDYVRVALDSWMSAQGSVTVSTVWLGLDHSFTTDPTVPIIIFETMVFGPGREESKRYTTEDESRSGHAQMVALIRGRFPEIGAAEPFQNEREKRAAEQPVDRAETVKAVAELELAINAPGGRA